MSAPTFRAISSLVRGPVRTASDDEADPTGGNAGFGQFPQDRGDQLAGGGRPAEIVDDDDGAPFSAGGLGDPG